MPRVSPVLLTSLSFKKVQVKRLQGTVSTMESTMQDLMYERQAFGMKVKVVKKGLKKGFEFLQVLPAPTCRRSRGRQPWGL